MDYEFTKNIISLHFFWHYRKVKFYLFEDFGEYPQIVSNKQQTIWSKESSTQLDSGSSSWDFYSSKSTLANYLFSLQSLIVSTTTTNTKQIGIWSKNFASPNIWQLSQPSTKWQYMISLTPWKNNVMYWWRDGQGKT